MAIAIDAPKNGRAASIGLFARARGFIPRGTLPYDQWRSRHQAVLILLWAHVFIIFAFGLYEGFGLLHVTLETGFIALAAVWATAPRAGRSIRTLAACLGLTSSSAILVHFS